MEDLTPEQLEALIGTDYETVIADLLRQKGDAQTRASGPGKEIGQVGDGNVFFDPFGAVDNYVQRSKASGDARRASADLDKVLAEQNAGRKSAAYTLAGQKQPLPPPIAPDGAEVLGDVQARPSFLQRFKNQF